MITAKKIRDTVADLCLRANLRLRADVRGALEKARKAEKNSRAKYALDILLRNADIARDDGIAICQDTGIPVVFVELGDKAKAAFDIRSAVIKGVEQGYKKGALRNSVIRDPLARRKPPFFSPVPVHFQRVGGSKVKITVMPKGFGSENKTVLKMFNPTVDIGEIKRFVVDTVKNIGADACPPYVIGLGVGGTSDYACLLAKKALLRPLGTLNKDKLFSRLEKELADQINKLKIGAAGLGGGATCLGVAIEQFPTHIAGLPVCINISCHALRSASAVIK